MGDSDHTPAPAVRDSLALAELDEFASRAPHLDFAIARRRAIADALLGPIVVRRITRDAPKTHAGS